MIFSCLRQWTFLAILTLVAFSGTSTAVAQPETVEADVCIYGATPSGILAAVAVQRAGRSAVIVEPSRWVGGILGSGLKPMQDCPNYAATGGMTRGLLKSLGQPNWTEDRTENRRVLAEISPKTIREDFQKLLAKHKIRVIFDHRIAGCTPQAGDKTAIQAALFDRAPFDELGTPVVASEAREALRVAARIYIDASYEGDLLAKAGVSYRVGRESTEEFGEEFAGVQPPVGLIPVDPFKTPGDPESGLLRGVEKDHCKPLGAADDYTQAYNFRYYTTSDPAHRAPFGVPEDYRAEDFELVGRYVEYLKQQHSREKDLRQRLIGIFPGWKNSGEWNYQRNSLISMSPVGISRFYDDGDVATHVKIWQAHRDYLSGLQHFMSTDDRVPEFYRKEVAALGLDRRPHPETAGWPHQLYVRVSRRLAGRYTVQAHDVYNKTEIEDPICLAQYGIDVYPVRRIWLKQDRQTLVGLEGKMFVGGSRGPTNQPYPIAYRAITPKPEECTNLLVPVCFSATHLGYASARMEPVFMICGESAGIAACQALKEKCAVQAIDQSAYRRALERAGQKLVWDPVTDRPDSGMGKSADRYSMAELLKDCDSNGDNTVSQSEWNEAKAPYEWLFEIIDISKDGQIVASEYQVFQKYKAKHPDWQKRIKITGLK
ncbi:MAG TPA: protein-xanthan lyase [Planctomycetaceae bacterium]|nr:protein-xanthan lyase [Planctomycetaceae bacterium]